MAIDIVDFPINSMVDLSMAKCGCSPGRVIIPLFLDVRTWAIKKIPWWIDCYRGLTHNRETYQPTSIMRWDRGIFNGSRVVGSWGFMIWTAMVFWRLRRGPRWFGWRWPWAGNLGRGFLAPGFSFTLGFPGMWHTHTHRYIYIYTVYIYIYDYMIIYIYIYTYIYIYCICNSITFTTTIWHLYIYKYRYHQTSVCSSGAGAAELKGGATGEMRTWTTGHWGFSQQN